MKVIFRTDASLVIGSGHVFRCLTLAEALRDKGATVDFICRLHEGNLCELIKQRGFRVMGLPVPLSDFHSGINCRYAGWLGANWQDDAEQTRSTIAASNINLDWLIVDHYAVDHHWEDALRTSVKHIMVIDDLADRLHDCDLLLDQNLVEQMHTRYADKVPTGCDLLLGPEYALLPPLYAELHERVTPRRGPVRRIFIFFGRTDSVNLTGHVLAAFLQLNRAEVEVDVVISSGSPHEKDIRCQVAGHGNIHIHNGLSTLAPLIAKSDLAIGAGGATSWERLCLGVPSIVITVAENQRLVAEYLQKKGLIYWLGDKDNVDGTSLTAALVHTLNMSSLLDWSSRCLQVCSGQGVRRVLTAMMATMKSKIFQSLPQNLA